MKVAVEGAFIYAPPSGYDPVVTNAGEFKLQAVGRQPLYDGGARKAAVASGKKSKSEELGYGDNEFVPWQIGAVM